MAQVTSRSLDSDGTDGSWHTAGMVVGTCAGRPGSRPLYAMLQKTQQAFKTRHNIANGSASDLSVDCFTVGKGV